jgi:hypothetical protein
MLELDRLQAELASLNARAQREQLLMVRISAIRGAKDTLAELEPKIAELTRWRDYLMAWRADLCARLLACPEQQRGRPGMDREDQLKLSISNIDHGCESHGYLVILGQPLADLMRAAGYVPREGELSVWSGGFGSLVATNDRLEVLQRQRDAAQAVLDASI